MDQRHGSAIKRARRALQRRRGVSVRRPGYRAAVSAWVGMRRAGGIFTQRWVGALNVAGCRSRLSLPGVG
jgi:hypothetical protein